MALRIGFVGAGSNTRKHHLPKLKAIDGVQLVSVANRSRASSEQVAAEFGGLTVYDDWRALVEATDTDAIVIGTWPYLHCPVTLAALTAGKHVLTEARMALDANEARQMLQASRRRPDLTCMVVPQPLTLPVDAAIQAKVREGFLGELLNVQISAGASGFPDFEGPLGWRHDREFSGWNTLNMGIWYEGMTRWVGPATRVMANARTVVRRRTDTRTGELRHVAVPDHVDILADMACGAAGRLTFSAVLGHAPASEAWLFGTEGTLHYDASAKILSAGRRGDAALAPVPIPPEQQGVWRVEQAFVNAVRGLEPVRQNRFADGVHNMEFTEAVGRSAATGIGVLLPSV